MVPGSLVGVLLFVALLAPGFVYLECRERRHPGVRYSTLRETSLVVVASLASVGTAMILFGILRIFAPTHSPDIGAFIRGGSEYTKSHYLEAALWSVGVLVVACLLAAMAAVPPKFLESCCPKKFGKWITYRRGTGGSIMQQSGWGVAFIKHPKTRKYLEVVLTDGTCINGLLGSSQTQVRESDHRDLVIAHPISVREIGGDYVCLSNTGVIVVSATRIKYLAVQYVEVP